MVDNIELAVEIINFIAPEHLHLHISNYKKLLPKINNAGGIFLGEYSVEAFGDYIVGPIMYCQHLVRQNFHQGWVF